MKLKLKQPLKEFKIHQYFGQNALSFYREDGMKGHNGIDFKADDGEPVFASHDGRVTFAGYDGSGGLGVVIRTEQVFESDKEDCYYKTIYWHLKRGTLLVTGGQSVKGGELIAQADNTGRSTGSHLHFALKPIARGEQEWVWWNLEQDNGYFGAIDPLPFFEKTEPELTETLRRGSRGEQVKILQKLLGGLVVDGIFGKNTDAKVREFQKSKGLVVDGIVGKNTRRTLVDN